MESVPVLDDRMYLPACSAAKSSGPFALACHDQPPAPVFEICQTVETVIAPSPPVKVPSVVVNDSPTLAVPLTDGLEAFLQDQQEGQLVKMFLGQEHKLSSLYVLHTPALSLLPHSLAQQNRN